MNFSDDSRFVTYDFTDETSQFDPEAFWNHGADCYYRRYCCRVPRRIVDKPELLEAFIAKHCDDIDSGFWADAPNATNKENP